MRTLAIIAAALMIALSPPALAKSDKAPSAPPGQSANADKPAKPDKPDKPEPPGQTGKGETPAAGDGHGPPAGPPGQTTGMELDEAQRAVEAREALPLVKIIAVAESRTTGHVINARLVRIDGALLYQLTLLDDTGLSWREYYLARTGRPVALR